MHYHKNRVVKHHFFRSGHTVSRHFNDVLRAVIRLQGRLLVKPEPITQACIDDRWKNFQVTFEIEYITRTVSLSF